MGYLLEAMKCSRIKKWWQLYNIVNFFEKNPLNYILSGLNGEFYLNENAKKREKFKNIHIYLQEK